MTKELQKVMEKLADYRAKFSPAEMWAKPLYDEVVATFKEFWDLKPSEKEFARAFKGIPIYPELLYYMVNNPTKI